MNVDIHWYTYFHRYQIVHPCFNKVCLEQPSSAWVWSKFHGLRRRSGKVLLGWSCSPIKGKGCPPKDFEGKTCSECCTCLQVVPFEFKLDDTRCMKDEVIPFYDSRQKGGQISKQCHLITWHFYPIAYFILWKCLPPKWECILGDLFWGSFFSYLGGEVVDLPWSGCDVCETYPGLKLGHWTYWRSRYPRT